MTGDSNMNLVISQGTAVKEVFNIKKQTLEVQQQTGMQERIEKNREEKTKIQKTDSDTKIQVKDDANRKDREHSEKRNKRKKEEQVDADENRTDSSFIDIRI